MHTHTQVEPFLMVPHGEGGDAEARRSELLRRRTQAVSGLGLTAGADMPHYLADLEAIRSTADVANPSGRMDMQPIYAVTPATREPAGGCFRRGGCSAGGRAKTGVASGWPSGCFWVP